MNAEAYPLFYDRQQSPQHVQAESSTSPSLTSPSPPPSPSPSPQAREQTPHEPVGDALNRRPLRRYVLSARLVGRSWRGTTRPPRLDVSLTLASVDKCHWVDLEGARAHPTTSC